MKTKKRMGLYAMAIGCIFLFNPCVDIFDIFPDIIGMILICSALSSLSHTETHLAEAYKHMKRAMWVAAGKFIVMVISVFLRAVGLGDILDGTMMLVFALVSCVLELVWLIPGFSALFAGLDFLSVGEETDKKHDSGDLPVLTPIFIVVRSVLAFVPDLTYLTSEYGDVTSGSRGSENLRPALIAFCIIAVTVIGAVWLYTAMKYFLRLGKDESFVGKLREVYITEFLSNKRLVAAGRVRFVSGFMTGAFVFTLTLMLGGAFPMPEFLFGITCLLSSYLSREYLTVSKDTVAVCVLYSASAIASGVFLNIYGREYSGFLRPFEEEGFLSVYLPFIVLYTVSSVFMILVCKKMHGIRIRFGDMCVCTLKNGVITEDTGVTRRSELAKKENVSYIMQIVYCVASPFLLAGIPFGDISEAFAVARIIKLFFCIAVMISNIVATDRLREEAEYSL